MKKTFTLASLLLVFFAATASAQWNFPGMQAPKTPKAISLDPNVRAPQAQVAEFTNRYYILTSTLAYDFNSESCKLTLTLFDRTQDAELGIKVDYSDGYADFAKYIKKLVKESNKMLEAAEAGNSRKKINAGKVPTLRGYIKEQASENEGTPAQSINLSMDAHFVVQDDIAAWDFRFSPSRPPVWGGAPGGRGNFGGALGGGQQNVKLPTFSWTVHAPKEFDQLLEAINKNALDDLNKELVKQGKALEANYQKED